MKVMKYAAIAAGGLLAASVMGQASELAAQPKEVRIGVL